MQEKYIVYVGLKSQELYEYYCEKFIELEQAKASFAKAYEYYGGLTIATGIIINLIDNSLVYKID